MKYVALALVISLISCKSIKDEDLIILVNVGELDSTNERLIRSILMLDSFKVKVIGIDLELSKHNILKNHEILSATLNKFNGSFVLRNDFNYYYAENLEGYTNYVDDDIPEFKIYSSKISYSNLIKEEDPFGTIKKFSSWEYINKRKVYQFGIQVALMYDSTKTIEYLNNKPKINNIDFQSGKPFKVINAEDLLNGRVEPNVFEGKIVLLGLFGNGFEDRYYSGSIKRGNGSFEPDMFDMEFQANIVMQALRK